MVTPFLSKHDGAPPLPPEGGYQHGRRYPSSPHAAQLSPSEAAGAPDPLRPQPEKPKRRSILGWSMLGISVLFALILLILLATGATDALYSTTMIALQLLVAAGVIAALVVPRARRIAVWALVIALVFNIGTVGAMSALQTSASGTYDGESEQDKAEQAYPGVEGLDPDAVLAAESLEQVQERMEALSQRIRDRLTERFDFTWVKVSDGGSRPERNGYGGESMLQEYTAPVWATEQPLHDYDEKLAVMDEIDAVIAESGLSYGLYPLNESTGISQDSLEKLYGGADPREQVVWEHYTEITEPRYDTSQPEPSLFYATITDLSKDSTGQWTQRQEAEAEDGAPLEGLQLMFLGRQLLSGADRDAFEQGVAEAPVS